MKRTMILGAILLGLAACSTDHRLLAPDREESHISSEKPSTLSKRGVDPVCGTSMDGESTAWHATYEGVHYYFDSEECRRQFVENPELYKASAR